MLHERRMLWAVATAATLTAALAVGGCEIEVRSSSDTPAAETASNETVTQVISPAPAEAAPVAPRAPRLNRDPFIIAGQAARPVSRSSRAAPPPPRPERPRLADPLPPASVQPRVTLQGVMVWSGHCVALIDGKTQKVGDVVRSEGVEWVIESIDGDAYSVTFTRDGGGGPVVATIRQETAGR